jgi:glycosyltransferase involved in cell wall biosynthesis
MNERNQPLVTVVLPTFNRMQGLKKSLDCFVNQSYKNIEIIISDNHSELDPTDLVEAYKKTDARIKFYRQKTNIGMKANGDFLFSYAQGKYILLGSDDDWWDLRFIETMVDLLENNPNASCAISDFQETLKSGSRAIYRSNFSRIKSLLGQRSSRFPDHLPLLMEFSDGHTISRLENFIKQSEADGKANVHRALCRRIDFISSVKDLYKLGLAECWGFDQLLAFMLLVKGELVVSPRLMFKCVVNNTKNYEFEISRIEYLLGYEKIIDRHLGGEGVELLKNALNIKLMEKELGFKKEFINKLYLLYKIEINGWIGEERVNRLKKINHMLQSKDFLWIAKKMQKTMSINEFRYNKMALNGSIIEMAFNFMCLSLVKIRVKNIISGEK